MTIKDFKKFLEQFPEDAEVRVIEGYRGAGWEGDGYRVIDFDGKEYETWEYTDFTNNQWVKPTSSYYNKKYLTLGNSE